MTHSPPTSPPVPFVLARTFTGALSHLVHVDWSESLRSSRTLCGHWVWSHGETPALSEVECRGCFKFAFQSRYYPQPPAPPSTWMTPMGMPEEAPFLAARTRLGHKNHLVFLDPSGRRDTQTLCGNIALPTTSTEQLKIDCNLCIDTVVRWLAEESPLPSQS